jgi:D-galactarolactone cycloisomerase
MLEFDTTPNRFLDGVLQQPLRIQEQVARDGTVGIPDGPGIGVDVDLEFVRAFEVT